MDWLLIMITNPFEIPLFKTWKHFHFLAPKFIPSLKTSTKFKVTKYLKHKSIYFMHMLTLKQGLHLSKVHSEIKTFMNKNKETALNWSFILTPLLATDKFFEFCRIYVNQSLNFIFEYCAILCGMPPNSSMVFTFGLDIVPFWIWRSFRPSGNDRNPIVLDQYGD